MPARDACSPMRIPSWRGRSASPGTVGGFRARLVRRRERRLVQPVSCAPAHRSRGLTSAVDAALLHVSADLGARSAAVPPRGDGGYPGRLRPHRASAPGLGTAACSTPVQQPDDGRRAPNESVSVEHVPHKPSTNARPVHPRRTWGLFPGWCGDAAPSGGATAPYFPMRSREVLLRNAEHGIGGGKEVPVVAGGGGSDPITGGRARRYAVAPPTALPVAAPLGYRDASVARWRPGSPTA